MKLLIVSKESNLGNINHNTKSVIDIIKQTPSDIQYIVLPPLFLTGYYMKDMFLYRFFVEMQYEAIKEICSILPNELSVITTIHTGTCQKAVCFNKNGFYPTISLNLVTSIEQIKNHTQNILLLDHKWTMGSKNELITAIGENSCVFCSPLGSDNSSVSSGIAGYTLNNHYYYFSCDCQIIDTSITPANPIEYENVYDDIKMPFVPTNDKYIQEAIDILSYGLKHRLNQIGIKKMVVGVSGGLDSTLTLLLCYHIDKLNTYGITMPGYGTTIRTKSNATDLMKLMSISNLEISIKNACEQHFDDIDHHQTDVVFENAQARERTQILLNYANKIGGIHIGTGDLSEAMLGFTTYGGDHLSMFNLNLNIPKTLVRRLVEYFAIIYPHLKDVLIDICKSPISPELLPTQQHTENIIGSYIYNDFAIYHTIVNRLSKHDLQAQFLTVFNEANFDLDKFYNRIFANQFKRNCTADTIAITKANLLTNFVLPSSCKNCF